MKDWVDWHRAYDSPTSTLTRRLAVVEQRLQDALDAVPRSDARLLSLCAGDGRDVIGVLGSRATPSPARVVLVEQDETLAERARAAATASGLPTVEVRRGDAGACRTFEDVVPVDVLMLCGIFGNIHHAAVERIVRVLPRMVVTDGFVIWTRGRSESDRRAEVREWFAAAGFEEVAFDGAPEPYGVGLNRLRPARSATTEELSERLFTFIR